MTYFLRLSYSVGEGWFKRSFHWMCAQVCVKAIFSSKHRRVLSPLKRVQLPVLNDGIRKFYDESSGLWENMWGEHMHHGYYDPESRIRKNRKQAQIDMIDNVLAFADVTEATRMLDVGCGIGGSSRCYLKCPLVCRCFRRTPYVARLFPVLTHPACTCT
jgi:hypothetical protein